MSLHFVIFSLSSGTSQRTNVISCVTVHDSHDSDSSTSSPLSPKTTSVQPTKSLAIIMPSVKTQPGDTATAQKAAAAPGRLRKQLKSNQTLFIKIIRYYLLFIYVVFFFFLPLVEQTTSGSGKSKKSSAQQSSRPGESTTERHQRAASSRSQPLNLSQVTRLYSCCCVGLKPTVSVFSVDNKPTMGFNQEAVR